VAYHRLLTSEPVERAVLRIIQGAK
jgi:hypothetical protein